MEVQALLQALTQWGDQSRSSCRKQTVVDASDNQTVVITLPHWHYCHNWIRTVFVFYFQMCLLVRKIRIKMKQTSEQLHTVYGNCLCLSMKTDKQHKQLGVSLNVTPKQQCIAGLPLTLSSFVSLLPPGLTVNRHVESSVQENEKMRPDAHLPCPTEPWPIKIIHQ